MAEKGKNRGENTTRDSSRGLRNRRNPKDKEQNQGSSKGNTTPDSSGGWLERSEGQDQVNGKFNIDPVYKTDWRGYKGLFTSDRIGTGLPEANLDNGVRGLREDDLNTSPMDWRQYMDEHDLEIQDGAEDPDTAYEDWGPRVYEDPVTWSVSEPGLLSVRGVKEDDLGRTSDLIYKRESDILPPGSEPNLDNGVRGLKEDDLGRARDLIHKRESDTLPPGSEPNLDNGVRGLKEDDLELRHTQRPTGEDMSDKESLDPYGRPRKAYDAAMRSWRQMLIDNHNRRMAQNQKQVRNAQILGIGKALGDMIGAIWGGAASLRNNAVAVVPQAQASKTAQQIEKLINEGVVEAKDYDKMMFNLAMQKGKSDIELAKALDELGIKAAEREEQRQYNEEQLQKKWDHEAAVLEEKRKYDEEQLQKKWDHEAAVLEEKRKYDKQKPNGKDKSSSGNGVNRSLGDSPVIREYIDSHVQKEFEVEYEETDPLTGITETKKRKQRISESDREAQRKRILQDITSIHKHYKIPSSAPDEYPLGWERFIKDTLSGLGRERIKKFLGAGFSSSDIIEYYESVDGGTIDIQSDKFAEAIKTKSDIDKVKALKKGGVKLKDLLTALQARSIDQIYNALTGDE